MKKLTMNEANKKYYSDAYIKGWENGVEAQFKADIDNAPTIDAVPKWIPIKWHEITEDEREREGYPQDWVFYLDCEMPSDGQEILVQTKSGYIRWDVCYSDGELSLDSGWDWIDDIAAWMPLPEPYKGGEI